MQFFKTASWVVLAVAIALFSKANWYLQPSYNGYVPIKLWEEWSVDVRLPVLIVSAFLLGLLPMWIFSRVSRWRIRRRLVNAEQALAATTPAAPVVPVSPVTSVSDTATLPVGESDHDAAENAGFRP